VAVANLAGLAAVALTHSRTSEASATRCRSCHHRRRALRRGIREEVLGVIARVFIGASSRGKNRSARAGAAGNSEPLLD
jgi:hypothetical protein